MAAALAAEAPALVARWQAQSRAVAPRVVARRAGDAIADGVVTQAIGALGCALRRTPRCQDDVLRAGWEFGSRAHGRGTSLHYMVKELDLLEAMVLYVAEQAAAVADRSSGATAQGAEGADAAAAPASAAEVMGAARRLHRSFAALRLAATKGFTHAYVETLRGRYRTLRHDLRNPIGTIKSAVALMDDESLPAEVRFGQRYRAMVTRNATSLETLVGAALGDSQVSGPALTLQDVSLGELALTVRRDLREDAEAAGCTIEIAPSLGAPSLPAVRVDSTTFELVLRSMVDAALGQATAGSAVVIDLRALKDRQAAVAVRYVPAVPRASGRVPAVVPALAADLAQRSGGRVWREDDATLLLEIPIEVRSSVEARVDDGSATLSDGPAALALDSFVTGPYGDGARPKAEQLPRGGGPPDGEVASSPG
ncbi:MAG TPA: hypothetical protein VFJ74_18110 [Gemmatimonadaceae bacterium]|nr:hypothetical protein [Gemmatimonadaceae bacterium]